MEILRQRNIFKLTASILIFVMCVICFSVALTSTHALGEENTYANFDVVYPNSANFDAYMALKSPQITASYKSAESTICYGAQVGTTIETRYTGNSAIDYYENVVPQGSTLISLAYYDTRTIIATVMDIEGTLSTTLYNYNKKYQEGNTTKIVPYYLQNETREDGGSDIIDKTTDGTIAEVVSVGDKIYVLTKLNKIFSLSYNSSSETAPFADKTSVLSLTTDWNLSKLSIVGDSIYLLKTVSKTNMALAKYSLTSGNDTGVVLSPNTTYPTRTTLYTEENTQDFEYTSFIDYTVSANNFYFIVNRLVEGKTLTRILTYTRTDFESAGQANPIKPRFMFKNDSESAELNAKKAVYIDYIGLNGNAERLLVCDETDDKILKMEFLSTDVHNMLKPLSAISSSGSTPQKLDTPTDIALNPGESFAFIADSANNRVLRVDVNTSGDFANPKVLDTKVVAPTLAEASSDGAFVYASGTVYYFKKDGKYVYEKSVCPTPAFTVVDMKLSNDGKLYLLKKSTTGEHLLEAYFDVTENPEITKLGEPKTFRLDYEPVSIATSYSGSNIYVLSESTASPDFPYEISSYSAKGIAENTLTKSKTTAKLAKTAFIKPSALDVDFSGSLYVVDNTLTTTYLKKITLKNENEYDLATIKTFTLKSGNMVSATFNNVSSITILPLKGRVYIANKGMNLIQRYSIANESNPLKLSSPINSFKPDPSKYFTTTYVGKFKTDSTVMLDPQNFEDPLKVKAGELFYVLGQVEHNETGINYYFGVHSSGYVGFIFTSSIDRLSANTSTDMGETAIAMNATITIYNYPYLTYDESMPNNIKANVDLDTVLTVIDNVCEVNGTHAWQNDSIKWYKVSYKIGTTDVFGYVLKSDISPNIPLEPPHAGKTAKIKSGKIGEKVAVYVLPDIASHQLFNLPDGTEVRLVAKTFDKDSEFTEIVYQGTKGYVLTEHLIASGLTTVQIIAIVLSVIAIVITIATVLLTIYFKKKSKQSKDINPIS